MGKRKLEAAIDAVKDRYDVTVRWRPYLLRSNMPEEGVPKPEPEPGNPRVNPRLKSAGDAVGIDFTGKCARYPNTLRAHALLEYAGSVDGGSKQNDLQEVVFKAYFTDGLYPDTANLMKQAEQVGFNAEEVKKVITDQKCMDEAHEKARDATREGVTGVPCFFMNGQRTFSGAQDPSAFIQMFDKIHERFPLK